MTGAAPPLVGRLAFCLRILATMAEKCTQNGAETEARSHG